MRRALARFASTEDGATAIEYGLLAALIAVVAIAGFSTMGNGLINLFGRSEVGVGGVVASAIDKLD
jgi:pilus assembly protein Flp/PilA